MSDIQSLAAEPRERAGKGSARAARREGRVPAVIYGEKRPPILITVGRNELVRLVNKGTFMTNLFEIEVNGKIESVLPRDLQVNVVSDEPIHVDFLRLAKGATVLIEVPVHFFDEEESPGLKGGGVLNIVRHTIECNCPATAIPERFDISLEGLELGESVHVSAVDIPEGVTLSIEDRDFTIATIVAPSRLKSVEQEAAEAEEAALAEAEAAEGEAVEGEAAEEAATDGEQEAKED
jgi:large subunit ribosomal protein L25